MFLFSFFVFFTSALFILYLLKKMRHGVSLNLCPLTEGVGAGSGLFGGTFIRIRMDGFIHHQRRQQADDCLDK